MIKWIRDFESSRIQTKKLRILINVLNTAIFGIWGVSEHPYQEMSLQLFFMASRFIDAIRDDFLFYLIFFKCVWQNGERVSCLRRKYSGVCVCTICAMKMIRRYVRATLIFARFSPVKFWSNRSKSWQDRHIILFIPNFLQGVLPCFQLKKKDL